MSKFPTENGKSLLFPVRTKKGKKTYLYDMDSYQVVKSKKCEIWFRYDFTEADFRDGVPVSND